MAKKNPKSPASSKPVSPDWNAFFHHPQGIGLLCAGLFALVLWTFWPALQGQFLFHDDYGTLQVNEHVNHGLTWSGVAWAIKAMDYNQWIPLAWCSNMLDFSLYGANPWGHHLTNVLFHAGSSVLVFLLVRKMTGALWRSLIVAGLFAFHPQRVESVAWICERKDVLCVFFGLLALLAYLEYAKRAGVPNRKQWLFYGLTYFLFALCLLSKQAFITFPCVLLLLDFWPLDRLKTGKLRRVILEKIPFFVILPFISKISYLAQLEGGALDEMPDLPMSDRLGNALVSYVKYIRKFFWPSDLSVFYSHPGHWPGVDVVLAGLLLAIISLLAFFYCRKFPWFFVGWFWFVGTLVPVLGFVQLYSLAMADRFTYLPEIGLYLAVVWGVYTLTLKWRHQARFGWVVAGLMLVICIGLTRYQITFWTDEVTLLKRAVAVNDRNYVAQYLLGYLTSSSDPDGAYAEIKKSADINPHYFQAQLYIGQYALAHGQPKEAIEYFNRSNQKDMRTFYGRGQAWYQLGDADQAIHFFEIGVTNDPNDPPPRTQLAQMLLQTNRVDEAITQLKAVCALTPNDPNAFNNLGIVLVHTGHFDEAINAFQSALNLAPTSTQLQGNLAAAQNAKLQAAQALTNAPPAVPIPPPAH